MNIIIPYEQSLEHCNGAFIKPNGEILYINDNNHESFAMNYCLGEYYHLLNNIKNNYPFYNFDEFKKEFNFYGNKQDINIFSSSNLTYDQIILYKLWQESHQYDCKTFYSDFLVCILGFDKVENIIKNTITTSNKHHHIRFYNYYIMDWNIDYHPQLIYNNEKKLFEPITSNNYTINSYTEREYEEEITEIKTKIKKEIDPISSNKRIFLQYTFFY